MPYLSLVIVTQDPCLNASYTEPSLSLQMNSPKSSIKLPHGILTRVNIIWNNQHPTIFYGDSYHTINLGAYFEQNLGLAISTPMTNLAFPNQSVV